MKSLAEALSISESRFDLVVRSFSTATSAPGTFLDLSLLGNEYRENLVRALEVIRSIFVLRYADFQGRPLIEESELVLALDENAITANAFARLNDSNQVEVRISLGLLVSLDLLLLAAQPHASELSFADVAAEAPTLDLVESDALRRIVSVNFVSGLSEKARLRICEHLLAADADLRRCWAQTTVLSLLWILSHEVGHFLCGHLGFFRATTGSSWFSEFDDSQTESPPGFPLSKKMVTRWASELMADTYATIRLFWIVTEEIIGGRWEDSPSTTLHQLQVSTIVALSVFMGRQIGKDRLALLKSSHPTHVCRLFNSFATTFFLVFPLKGTQFDPRKNPFDDFWRLHLAVDERLFLVTQLYLLEESMSFFSDMHLASLQESELAVVREIFCGSLISARFGGVTCNVDCSLNVDLAQWTATMKALCTKANLRFGSQLRETWLTRGQIATELMGDNLWERTSEQAKVEGFTNDPAYKVLDDWMSNMLAGFEATQEVYWEKIGQCISVAKSVVMMRSHM